MYTTGATPGLVATGFTTVTGTYTVRLMSAGSYDVCFDACRRLLVVLPPLGTWTQCYRGPPWDGFLLDITGATAVTVTVGAATTNIDASLVTAGAISGTVTDTTFAPLEGVDVEVFTTGANVDEVGFAATTASGNYTVTGLPTGSYDVCFLGMSATGSAQRTVISTSATRGWPGTVALPT